MADNFQDHFSSQADVYRRFRPEYPEALFHWLAEQCSSRQRALDCACGSGQASHALLKQFEHVVAVDASEKQLVNAPCIEGISYLVAEAEKLPFKSECFDMVTVAQALHWFDHERFFQEVIRVLKPEAYFAAWTYQLFTIHPEIDELINFLYSEILGPYWPLERKHVESKYHNIPFPFQPILSPEFTMELEWDLDHLLGYLSSWSAVQKYQRMMGFSPLDQIVSDLRRIWGQDRYRVVWPLHIRLGRKIAE